MSKLYAIIGTDSNNEIVAFAGYDRDLGEDRVVIFDANQYTEMPTEWSRKYSRYALRKKCNRITYKPSHIVEAFTNPNSKNQFVWFYVRQFATELNNRRFKGITTWRPVRLNSKDCPICINMRLRNRICNNRKIHGLSKSEIRQECEAPIYWTKTGEGDLKYGQI